jgi:hypothetical protein
MSRETNKRKSPIKAYSTNILDYSITLSAFERESLVAEAKLKAERKKKPPKGRKS